MSEREYAYKSKFVLNKSYSTMNRNILFRAFFSMDLVVDYCSCIPELRKFYQIIFR